MKLTKIIALLLASLLLLTACTTPKVPEAETPKLELGNLQDIQGEITVSAYESMVYEELLKEAAGKFMDKYPGTKVNVQTHSAMPETKTMENDDGSAMAVSVYEPDKEGEDNYRSQANTQLMSGEGADLYALDVLSLSSYIENGQVENLTPYMEQDPDFHKEEYQENVLEKSKIHGGHYFLPLNYLFSFFSYDNNIMPQDAKEQVEKESLTLRELLKLDITPTKEGSGIHQLNYDEAQLVNMLINNEYSKLVDLDSKTAHFNEEYFLEILRYARKLKEEGKLPVYDYESALIMDDPQAYFEEMSLKKYLFNIDISFGLFQIYNKSNSFMFSTTAGGMGMEEADLRYAALAANEEGEVNAQITEGLFMNKNSQNKELAWAFLKFLVSEEMQSSPSASFTNHPLNNKARLAFAEGLFTGARWGEADEKTPEMEEEIKAFTTHVEESSNKIDVISPMEDALQNLVREELEDYFKGTLTAEEVAEKIQSKATLYLNE